MGHPLSVETSSDYGGFKNAKAVSKLSFKKKEDETSW